MPDAGPSIVRGPCSSCGAQLAADQRYCVECGQRIGPPLALPYALPAPVTGPPPGSWMAALPMPLQMVSAFAVLALGFGAVVGTAISPNLQDILAAPYPGVVAEAPLETPPASTGGGGGGAPPPVGGTAPALASSTAPTSSGGGGGGGGGGGDGGGKNKKKKKQKVQAPQAFSGTVVRVNPIAQSYTVSSGSALNSIHAASIPQVGDQVEAPVRKLKNGTYAEDGARTALGHTDVAGFEGTVTHCADLEQPSAPCDGSNEDDHYAYSVSSLGASILVSWPHSAVNPPPQVGSRVQVGVQIGAAFQPIDPLSEADWRVDEDCNPAYNEQNGLPDPAVVTPEITQTSLTVTGQSNIATLESVVQTRCLAGTPRLILSADDVRQSGRDLAPLEVPAGIDLNKLNPGQAVQTAVDIANGTLTLKGITSDQGAAGAHDATQGQGTLTGT